MIRKVKTNGTQCLANSADKCYSYQPEFQESRVRE